MIKCPPLATQDQIFVIRKFSMINYSYMDAHILYDLTGVEVRF